MKQMQISKRKKPERLRQLTVKEPQGGNYALFKHFNTFYFNLVQVLSIK